MELKVHYRLVKKIRKEKRIILDGIERLFTAEHYVAMLQESKDGLIILDGIERFFLSLK